MAQYMAIARAVIIGGSAAVAASVIIGKKWKEFMKGKCSVCDLPLKSENGPPTTICKLRCGHKVHDTCVRVYVHAFRNVSLKCPVGGCKETNVMGDAERRHYEIWVPENKFFCLFCRKIVEKRVVQSLRCWHSFCKLCLKNHIMGNYIMGLPPKCPMEECAVEIADYIVELIDGNENQ